MDRDDRDELVLLDRIRGRSLAEIGDEHGVSAEWVRRICIRQADEHISEVMLAMWVAQKEGEILALAIPAGFADDQTLAVRYLDWVLGKLVERRVKPLVHYRPTPGGSVVFAIEDANFKPKIVRRT